MSRPALRILWPTGTVAKVPTPTPAPAEAEVFRLKINGQNCTVRYWLPRAWAALPVSQRPEMVFAGSHGGYPAIEIGCKS
jgi:hypothetical protein